MLNTQKKLAYILLKPIMQQMRSEQKIYHFAFHKNLTVYYKKCMSSLARYTGRKYEHFNSLVDQFEQKRDQLDIASLNNHFIDLSKTSSITRSSLFIRDPRDLVVSGYFYHKRGAELWSRIRDPQPADFEIVNGCVPTALEPGESFKDCLNRLPLAEGLYAEMEFRKLHFESLFKWMEAPPGFVVKYEDIVGNEIAVFRQLGNFYRLNYSEINLLVKKAASNAISKRQTAHARDPKSGQWREIFPDEVKCFFAANYSELLRATGYASE